MYLKYSNIVLFLFGIPPNKNIFLEASCNFVADNKYAKYLVGIYSSNVHKWYFKKVGKSKCEVIDTWWQTETGSVLISPIAGITPKKPGSATLPFFGASLSLLDAEGNELTDIAQGNLCINSS